MLKNFFRKIFKLISDTIYLLLPQELFPNSNFYNTSSYGIIKLLKEERDREVYDTFAGAIKESLPFIGDGIEIRKYAIQLAQKNQSKYCKDDLFYLEFGVFKGATANFFSNYVKNLYAFDSFQGLKKDWNGMGLSKGHFNLGNKLPRMKSNIKVIHGYIENTLDDFLLEYKPQINFVHMDLDLYSSTKFALQKIKPYLVHNSVLLFDQFYNYINWKEGEYKAFQEVFSTLEFSYKAFRLNGCQVVIQIIKN